VFTARILFVAAEAKFFVTHRLPLALAARERGYDVHIATPRGPFLDVILGHELPWHEIVVRRGTRLIQEVRSIPNLVGLYRRVRPDLAHHVAVKAMLYGTVAARLTGVPAVVNALTGLGYAFDERRARSLVGRGITLAYGSLLRHPRMRFIFQNTEDRDVFVRHGWCADAAAVLIRGSGVDPDVFAPAAHPPNGSPLVVFAARLLVSKGVAEFVEAARRVKAAGIEARFVIVGESDFDNPESITPGQLNEWGREGAVEVWGWHDDMSNLLRGASLVVLPTYYGEGVPKVLIEAAACGLPIVTTDTPGCRDIVVNGRTGLLVPPRDAHALSAALVELLGDPARRREMGERARTRMVAEFSLERVVESTMAVYRELLGARR
jgi:glycosyltransferase involved in cell wall biosynthesis